MGDSNGFWFLHLLSYVNVKQWQNKVSLLEPLDRIESAFNDRKVGEWMVDNWHCSIYFSLVYIMAINLLTRYMSDKRAYDLRRPLSLWSFSLCVFSLIACLRISDYILEQPVKAGWTSALCDVSYYRGVRGKRLYAFLFPLSKLPELIDTFFIVFRRTPLSFLHWYHHITVFVYCWFSYAYPVSGGELCPSGTSGDTLCHVSLWHLWGHTVPCVPLAPLGTHCAMCPSDTSGDTLCHVSLWHLWGHIVLCVPLAPLGTHCAMCPSGTSGDTLCPVSLLVSVLFL